MEFGSNTLAAVEDRLERRRLRVEPRFVIRAIVEDARGVVFCLPGVPVEMKWLFENEVEPYLRRKFL